MQRQHASCAGYLCLCPDHSGRCKARAPCTLPSTAQLPCCRAASCKGNVDRCADCNCHVMMQHHIKATCIMCWVPVSHRYLCGHTALVGAWSACSCHAADLCSVQQCQTFQRVTLPCICDASHAAVSVTQALMGSSVAQALMGCCCVSDTGPHGVTQAHMWAGALSTNSVSNGDARTVRAAGCVPCPALTNPTLAHCTHTELAGLVLYCRIARTCALL